MGGGGEHPWRWFGFAFYDPEIQKWAKWMEAKLQLWAHGNNLPFNRAIHPNLGSGLRRERVVFLEQLKQNGCLNVTVLRSCDSTGESFWRLPIPASMLVRRWAVCWLTEEGVRSMSLVKMQYDSWEIKESLSHVTLKRRTLWQFIVYLTGWLTKKKINIIFFKRHCYIFNDGPVKMCTPKFFAFKNETGLY